VRIWLVILALTVSAEAQSWTRGGEGVARTLTYSATARLLGREMPVIATFYCMPERTETSAGAIGFAVEIAKPDSLTAFHFEDFEGPYSPASKRKLLEAAIVRKGTTAETHRVAPAGWYSMRHGFGFEVSAVFDKPGTVAKKVLQALRSEADELRITITDSRDADVKVRLAIPMKGKSGDFRWLLEGL
jgi:hypothetical protein